MYKVFYIDKAEGKKFINLSENFKSKEDAIKYAEEIKNYATITIVTEFNENFIYEILNINL